MIEMGPDRHNEIKVYVNGVNTINFLDPFNHRGMKYHLYDNIKDKFFADSLLSFGYCYATRLVS